MRRRSFLRGGFAAKVTLVAIVAAVCPARAAFDLDAFRGEMQQTSASLTSLLVRGTRTMVAMNQDQAVGPEVSVRVLLAFLDPMKVRMEVESPLGGTTLVVSDGEDVYTFQPETNQFTKRKVDPADDPSAPQHLDLPTPQENKQAMLAQIVPLLDADFTYVREVELEAGGQNRQCVVLERKGQGPGGAPFTATYWIDKQLHVVWRQESRTQQQGPQGPVDLQVSTVYEDIRLNEAMDPKLFRFDPMTDAQQVESLTRAPGLSASPWRGKAAPDFVLNDLDGITWTLSNLKGRVVLLNFWATWCGPCKMELPHVQKLHDEFRDRGLVVLAVSNEPRGPVERYIDTARYGFPALLDPRSEVWTTYRVSAIPVTMILDRQGNVAEHFVGAQTEETLRRALSNLGIQ